jgi:hypothetical protein
VSSFILQNKIVFVTKKAREEDYEEEAQKPKTKKKKKLKKRQLPS